MRVYPNLETNRCCICRVMDVLVLGNFSNTVKSAAYELELRYFNWVIMGAAACYSQMYRQIEEVPLDLWAL